MNTIYLVMSDNSSEYVSDSIVAVTTDYATANNIVKAHKDASLYIKKSFDAKGVLPLFSVCLPSDRAESATIIYDYTSDESVMKCSWGWYCLVRASSEDEAINIAKERLGEVR